MRYPFLVPLVLLASGTCHARPPGVDCAAVEQSMRDRVAAVQVDPEMQSAADSMENLNGVANGLSSPERACLAESDLRSFLSLFDHPQAAVRKNVPGFFAEFGVRAKPLLPEFRRRLEAAREHDRQWLEERHRIEGRPVVLGSPELSSLEYAIERIESARIEGPEWRDGVCARMEMDAANGDSRIVRYLQEPVAQADCNARSFDSGNSWFYTENDRETTVFSEAAFRIAKRLQSLSSSNLRAADVCPDRSGDSVPPELPLADMAVWWVGHDDRGYELVLRTLPSLQPKRVQIVIQLDADRPLVRGAVPQGSCMQFDPGF